MVANAEKMLADNADKFGTVWVQPTSLKTLVEQDRIRLAGTDNGLIIEIDGESWGVPESFRLAFFRP
jgi:hypothetical protein